MNPNNDKTELFPFRYGTVSNSAANTYNSMNSNTKLVDNNNASPNPDSVIEKTKSSFNLAGVTTGKIKSSSPNYSIITDDTKEGRISQIKKQDTMQSNSSITKHREYLIALKSTMFPKGEQSFNSNLVFCLINAPQVSAGIEQPCIVVCEPIVRGEMVQYRNIITGKLVKSFVTYQPGYIETLSKERPMFV